MIYNVLNNIPLGLIGNLQPYYLIEYVDFSYISIDISLSGAKFLNYFLNHHESFEERILVEISDERLNLLCSGELPIDYAFKNPEEGLVYACLFNKNGSIEKASYYTKIEFVEICSIPNDYFVFYDIACKPLNIDFQIQAKQRQRILVDVHVCAWSLKANLKYWAIKSFLIPFTELVKKSLRNDNPGLKPETLENSLNLGYKDICRGSLRTTLEFNYNPDLFGNSTELSNLTSLFQLFNSETEEDLDKYLDRFENKKFIAEYLKVLRSIIKHEATLETTIAAPNNYILTTCFNKDKAFRIKQKLDKKFKKRDNID
jgi:hypothetical protein